MRTGEHCGLYFHPRQYVKNNIKYRIASGASIAKYKHSQAFLLTELSFNPYHDFSNVAKEILLLKYDIWFDFLCEVEQYLLVQHPNKVSSSNIKSIIRMSNERVEYYLDILEKNNDSFLKDYTEVWKEVHSKTYELLKSQILSYEGQSPAVFFDAMTDSLISVMNHTLFELQEIDILFYTDGPLQFNLDSLCGVYDDFFNESLILNSYNVYSKIRKTDEIIIKKYSDVNFPFSQLPLKKILEENGIKYKVI